MDKKVLRCSVGVPLSQFLAKAYLNKAVESRLVLYMIRGLGSIVRLSTFSNSFLGAEARAKKMLVTRS